MFKWLGTCIKINFIEVDRKWWFEELNAKYDSKRLSIEEQFKINILNWTEE